MPMQYGNAAATAAQLYSVVRRIRHASAGIQISCEQAMKIIKVNFRTKTRESEKELPQLNPQAWTEDELRAIYGHFGVRYPHKTKSEWETPLWIRALALASILALSLFVL